MRRPRHLAALLITVLLPLALVGAACSSTDDGGSGSDSDDAATTSAPTTTEVDLANAPPRPSPGCADPQTDEVNTMRKDITVGDQQRFYLLTTPVPTRDPVPLVVDLHGLMEGAEIHSVMTQLGELGQEEGFMTVFPHGSGDPVRWHTEGDESTADLEYLDALLTEVGEQRCIDEARVYATGLSNGAMMSTFLACERSDVYAAIAPIDGITIPESCDPGRPVPALSSHGTQDPILLFNGGYGDIAGLVQGDGPPLATTAPEPVDLTGPGYPATVAEWAERNGCGGFTDSDVSESVIDRVYDCPAGADVEFYIVEGGGHSWPSSEFSKAIVDIVGPTTFDIDASALAWEFFQRFSLPAPS